MSVPTRHPISLVTMLLGLACAAIGLGYSGWRAELSAQGYYYGSTCVDGTLTVASLAGSDLDVGWTGISHDAVVLREAAVTTALDCDASVADCVVDGSGSVGTPAGAPLPLSAGGVSSCVVSELRDAVLGTYDCVTGCSSSVVPLRSSVYLVIDQEKPCPACVGDPTPNDGLKGGICDGGATPGAACDSGGISDLFQEAGGAPLDAGRTSSDCLPAGSPVGVLDLELAPLTTGTVSLDAAVDCLSGAFPPGSCHCAGQVQPNACIPDAVCPVSGVCENNPPDGVCSGQTYRQCDLTAGDRDCEDTFPGAGSCEARQRPCFGPSISRTGVCGTDEATLVSIFCVPATNAVAINTVSGLPGPAALVVPVRRSAVGDPVATPTPDGDVPTATPTAAAACGNGSLDDGEGCDDGNVAAGDCCSPSCQPEADDSACDDGVACTVDDACLAGFCSGDVLPVCEEITQVIAAGGSVTTDTESDGATSGDPLETIVTSRTAGEIRIVEMPTPSTPPPRGFVFLSMHVEITAPVAASVQQPLVITFLIDPSIAPGDTERTIAIFKDGDIVRTPCFDTSFANPDPCIAGRRRINGVIAITVNTTEASDWTFAVPGCAAAPLDGCRGLADPRKTTLLLSDRAGEGPDGLAWRWKKGARTLSEDFGDPLATESYSLCVYGQSSGDSTHVFQARAHAGGSCGGKPCWRSKPKGGFVYRSKGPNPEGLIRLQLKPSDVSKTEITVKGAGPNLSLPALPLQLPVTVQLQGTNGACWEANYFESGVGRNDAERFRATGGR